MMRYVSIFLVSIFFPYLLVAQNSDSISQDTIHRSIGAEELGLYIGGGISMAGGVGLGIVITYITENDDRATVPVIAGIWTTVPGSLIGAGLAGLLGKNHSKLNGGFVIGSGTTYKKLGDPLSGEKIRAGIHVRIESPKFNRWNYHLGYTYFTEVNYEYLERPASVQWMDFQLGLRYNIPINSEWSFYPFLESSLFYTQNVTFDSFGEKDDSDFLELESGIGIGLNYSVSNRWSLFTEVQLRMNDDYEKFNSTLGIGYEL